MSSRVTCSAVCVKKKVKLKADSRHPDNMKASSVSLLLGVSVLLLSGLTDSADSQVILEIPALPVVAGSDVTLRCRNKDQVALEAFFIRDGSKLGSGPEGQFTIRNISQSDEGLYWCYFDQTEESPWRRLRSCCPSSFQYFSSFSLPSSLLSPPVGLPVGSLVLLVLLVLVLVGVLLLRRNQTGLAVLTAAGELMEGCSRKVKKDLAKCG
ncbi:uncharacterized protein LOC119884121 [Micropterus salmoides]|uniref:uncharacterized protein LOC119884121 n=1 Tax=Micropterus salmoides TaxID=27706 RepID=UPI0018EE30C5|nr:uncharacterized protein LOC119884121 [Micropterus salmoides]